MDMIKLALSDTELSDILKDYSGPIDSGVLGDRMMQKYMSEFRFIHTQSVGQLTTFLDYVTYEYQIQGILLLISGMMSGSDPNRLLAKVHPLGQSPHLRMVLTFDKDERIRDAATGQEISPLMHLYKTVLIDTAVGKYFTKSVFLRVLYVCLGVWFWCHFGSSQANRVLRPHKPPTPGDRSGFSGTHARTTGTSKTRSDREARPSRTCSTRWIST